MIYSFKLTLLHNVILMLFVSCLLASVSSCDDRLVDQLNQYENRITQIEDYCRLYNITIVSLQELVLAKQSNKIINDISSIFDNGEQIVYSISFVGDEVPITIFNGSYDGQNDKGIKVPIVNIKKDFDGIWYWTLNNEWLLDREDNRIKVSDKDGTIPQFKVKENYWYLSADNGNSWRQLGITTGASGDQMFKIIRQDDCFVCFVLLNGQTISLPKVGQLKRYGVRWSLTDMNDLGTRCFDAIDKTAIIGKGVNNGFSDFDSIYPWSEIKRCNIRINASGTKIITFEGEPEFSLDGSNGDVFVRIPKFCVDKYIRDGYEYRVISRSDGGIHPVFIENGKELNEIYVGAFEGYINDGRLMSISDVIPTSNEVAETYLNAAKAKGLGYTLYDMRTVDAIWTLYAVEYGSRNTNQYLGYGFADFLQPVKAVSNYLTVKESASSTNTVIIPLMDYDVKRHIPVGSNITICDTEQTNILTQARITSIIDGKDYSKVSFEGKPVSVTSDCFIGSAACTTNFCESCGLGTQLKWHTGRALFVDGFYQEMQNPMRYRWIENIIGSLWHFLPDVSFNALQMFVCDNIVDYEFYKTTNPYRLVGDSFPAQTDNGVKNDVFGVNHWISDLINDPPFFSSVFGNSYSNNMTSRQGFGGYYYLSTRNVCIVNGGGFDHAFRCNMLTNRAWIVPGARWHLYGARLMYKNVDDSDLL